MPARAFWLPGTNVSINIDLVNIAVAPVTTTLSLTLPGWFDTIAGGSHDRRSRAAHDAERQHSELGL